MIIYSAAFPLFESEFISAESLEKTENGITSFYEKDIYGNTVLKFSTDPKKYLESKKPLQYLAKS
ncbi:MAG: hypothetical protein IJE40_04855 [Clostridia bacterium]|nr:hypothetical protein [Clostridia bacterium]